MTRFVAALLVASGRAVRAMVDPRTPGAGDLGFAQPQALLISAHQRGREQRAAEEDGIEAVRRAGREAWEIHQQRGGGQ